MERTQPKQQPQVETPVSPMRRPASRAEAWPGLAAWLKQMHALADRVPLDSALATAREPQLEQDTCSNTPPQASVSARRIRFVCNRRVIGFLIG